MRYFALLLLVSFQAFAGSDPDAIAELIGKTFDKPGMKTRSEPIVVVGEYAIADWQQGPHGGRALLKKRAGQWKILSCGGHAFSDKAHLVSAGIIERQASELVSQLSVAESGLDKKKVLLFDSFQVERSH